MFWEITNNVFGGKMRKKLFLILGIMTLILALNTVSDASEIREGIESFPESYRPYLQMLKNRHQNWEFSALYTGIDYNEVISNEYANSRNLVPITYQDTWKCTEERTI